MTITIEGKTPSGKNAITVTRSGHRFPSARFKAWKESAAWQVRQQVGNAQGFDTPVKATVRYTPGDLIRRDATGICDALWHLFEYCGVVKDDALIQQVDYLQMPLDRKAPRVLVTFEAIKNTAAPGPVIKD